MSLLLGLVERWIFTQIIFFVLFSGVVFEHEEKKAAHISLLNVLLNEMHTDFMVSHFMSPAVKGKTGLFSFLSSLSRSSTEVLHS